MFKTIIHRYGSLEVEEHETLEEAKTFGESISDMGEGFFECVIDENDIILYDGKKYVLGIENDSEVGKKYKFN